jgi:AcrR family transcriptional regulator
MNRLTRSERAAQSRQRVLVAAGKMFRKKGFHKAGLDEIADQAGFSKGVIYSQFGSKDELFLALMEERMEQRVGQMLELVRSVPQHLALREVWERGRKVRQSDVHWSLAVLEFRIQAARDPELNRRYQALHTRTLEGLAGVFDELAARTNLQLQYQPIDFARFIAALDTGGLLEELAEGPGSAFDLSRDAVWLLLTQSQPQAPDLEEEVS